MENKSLKKIVTAALLAAMTCIATMIIKVPTPTMGYIHLGDGFVLLCGVILGPVTGGLAAGIGSMFSDIFSGYVSWAPATFIIKALTGRDRRFLIPSFTACHQIGQEPLCCDRDRWHHRRSDHGHRLLLIRSWYRCIRKRRFYFRRPRSRHRIFCDRYPI